MTKTTATQQYPRSQQYSRCPRCSRILFPGKDNRLPAHRTPMNKIMPTRHNNANGGSVPLTGRDAPWCRGELW